MQELRFTFLSDGSSDRALMPLLRRLLEERLRTVALQQQWADLSYLRQPPRMLSERIEMALRLYPCQLLFVHRDAEKESPEQRKHEIERALDEVPEEFLPAVVQVIPVRMQETWLLVDEDAIRHAAGNPNGQGPLELPPVRRLEGQVDPKGLLHDVLRKASGLNGVRRKKFPVHQRVHLVAEHIQSLEQHRKLPAFRRLEKALDEGLLRLEL